MTADVIQARYDELDRVAARFGKASAASAELHRRITRCVEVLERGGWQGRGADAFFAEMRGTLYPAMQRLVKALDEGRDTTLRVKEVLRAAEEEAARGFASDRQSFGLGVAGGGGNGVSGGTFGDGNATSSRNSGGVWGSLSSPGFKGEYKFYQLDLGKNKGKNPRELGLKYGILAGDFGSKSTDGSTNLGPLKATGLIKGSLGDYEAGIGVSHSKKHGLSAGAYGEAYAAKVEAEGVIGDQDLGVTGGVEARGPGVEGFIGYRKGSVGAKIGGSLASAEGDVGVNVAGANVGLSGEIGLKAELGFKIGKKTEIELPFISLGISFGKAKDGKAD